MLEEKIRLGIDLRYTSAGVKQEGLVDEIVGKIEEYDTDIYFGPEFLFVEERNVMHVYDEYEKDQIFEEISERTKNRDSLIMPGTMVWHKENWVFNTLPIICQGKIVEYEKRTDAGSTYHATNRGVQKDFFYGEDDLVMKWRGYDCGFSICADRGSLLAYVNEARFGLLDFCFLSSCGVSLANDFTPVKQGGYGICADGCMDMNAQVWRAIDEYEVFDHLKADKMISRKFTPNTLDTSGWDEWQIKQHEGDEKKRKEKEAFFLYELKCLKEN